MKELARRVTKAVRRCRPELLDIIGVGPDSAAALLIAAGDNPERLASEASFAALCGVSPVEQSSGKTQRRRLNRGGNRQVNAALYRIVITRLRRDTRTRLYLEDAPSKACRNARSSVASNATLLARSTRLLLYRSWWA
ncbi:transposase [Streptomyces sp. RG80]|uniref:transposase n=1 Tax=Streptomyces sp. RG80 TaxID=3157340 RepID=UPI00338D576C